MWFRTRSRPDLDLGSRDDTYLGKADEVPAGALRPTPYSFDPAAGRDAVRGDAVVPARPTELQVLYRQTERFEPVRRQLARNLVIGAGASNAVNAAYNRLRTQVMRRLDESGWNTLAITSPSRGSGSSLTAVNLAISIARDLSHTVLLVELDLINPSLHHLLGFKPREGVVEHLLNDVPIQKILLNPGIDRLVVIPAGATPVTNSSELLASPKMARFVDELKRRYERRIILFDLPPVLAVDDAMAFSPVVDCALLVVESEATRVEDVRRALDYLGSTTILGAVLNRSLQSENNA